MAAALAAEIQAELAACQADPFLTALLAPDIPWGANEWLLEDQPRPGAIRRGVIDLLAFDGQTWWLLDFKTSRPAPGEDWEAFISQETEKYRPQLLAYREMARNWPVSGESPLAWLKEHYRLDLPPAGSAVSWPEPEMDVELITEVQSLAGETAPPWDLPAAWDFSPEAAPFEISFPSSLSPPPEETATRLESEAAPPMATRPGSGA